ncbi:MAG TPA: response regulator [Anaerolineae bacterium]|nr:response regulator [Anaerolineae bacterium]HQI86681.1 response regulator [Anaerolineae bacterium]HQK13429.1 response regulator [Anaerolineae bacterium]
MTKILYVEDDLSSQRLVQRILTAEGFEVIIADNGLAAIEAAQREKPDLVLMDINISGLDGYEVTTRLRTISGLGQVPIIAVTAATLRGDRERALVAGCNGYIPKPIDVDRFSDQIRAYMVGLEDKVGTPEERAQYLLEYNQRLVNRLEEKVRELEKANAELQRVEKMKSDFVVLAGHELRTPLTVIYGYLQILRANPAIPGDEETEGSPRHLLSKVSEAVKRLSEVIQDILNVSLIDANRLDLSREPVFLNSVIQSVLHNLRSFGPQRNLIFEIGQGIKKAPVIEGDPRRLHQAIGNIVSNAIKYTPENGTITIDAEMLEDVVHLWVKDTGVGIPPQELTHIFERFYVLEDVSLHRSSKTAFKGGGLGLGLAVAKGIIEAHNGKVWAESPGHDEVKCPGSTFHILLPIGSPFTTSTTTETRE